MILPPPVCKICFSTSEWMNPNYFEGVSNTTCWLSRFDSWNPWLVTGEYHFFHLSFAETSHWCENILIEVLHSYLKFLQVLPKIYFGSPRPGPRPPTWKGYFGKTWAPAAVNFYPEICQVHPEIFILKFVSVLLHLTIFCSSGSVLWGSQTLSFHK